MKNDNKKTIDRIVDLLMEEEGLIYNKTEITSILGLNIDGPTFRKLIQKQRETSNIPGFIIADKRGYWYTEDEEELRHYAFILMAKINSSNKQLKSIEKLFPIVKGTRD